MTSTNMKLDKSKPSSLKALTQAEAAHMCNLPLRLGDLRKALHVMALHVVRDCHSTVIAEPTLYKDSVLGVPTIGNSAGML